jgi:hypothetical protein
MAAMNTRKVISGQSIMKRGFIIIPIVYPVTEVPMRMILDRMGTITRGINSVAERMIEKMMTIESNEGAAVGEEPIILA